MHASITLHVSICIDRIAYMHASIASHDRITCIDHIVYIDHIICIDFNTYMHVSITHDILDFVTPPGIENSRYSIFRTQEDIDVMPRHSQYLLYSTLVLALLHLSIGM